jgi:hypothetical protein
MIERFEVTRCGRQRVVIRISPQFAAAERKVRVPAEEWVGGGEDRLRRAESAAGRSADKVLAEDVRRGEVPIPVVQRNGWIDLL